MQDRAFGSLGKGLRVRTADPIELHRQEGRLAVRIAHARDLAAATQWLKAGQSVLIECSKLLTPYICDALQADNPDLPGIEWLEVNYNRGPQPERGIRYELLRAAGSQFVEARTKPQSVLVLPHMDLIVRAVDGACELTDLVFWLSESSRSTKLAFWDPAFPLPKGLEIFFPNRLRLDTFDREVFWELVQEAEARLVSPVNAFTVSTQSQLYQHLAGTNVVDLRRILRAAMQEGFVANPSDPREVYQFIREQTGASSSVPDGVVRGYTELRKRLEREVVFPVEYRLRASKEELPLADALVPKGVLLYGKPGTGKTEWAKWLAARLNTPLFTVHGPELKNKLVGETEAAIRRIFAQARRAAPSLILMDEIDSLIPKRTDGASNFESSVVAQLLSEMDGMRKEESVIVVGTTNREDTIDAAFRRPGRFSAIIEVGNPTVADQREILTFFAGPEQMNLDLDGSAIEQLLEALKKQPQSVSGDHLRAICRHLLLDKLHGKYSRDKLHSPEVLTAAVAAILGKQVDRGPDFGASE